MDDARGMRHAEPFRDLRADADDRRNGLRLCARDEIAQRRAVHPFHGDVRRPSLDADVVDGDDVGMVER